MLSSRPGFCPPLFPPWVSIPNMVIHLGLHQCPPLSCPLSSSCWLHTEGRSGKRSGRKTAARGTTGRVGRGRGTRAGTHSSCVSKTNRAWELLHIEEFSTLLRGNKRRCLRRNHLFVLDSPLLQTDLWSRLLAGQSRHRRRFCQLLLLVPQELPTSFEDERR